MKPCNFPGRKKARREVALARVEETIDIINMIMQFSNLSKSARLISKEYEAAILRERINNPGPHFTKKKRAGKRRKEA